jgi:two-component system phosphate regulon sensor histidine kinase PhoR
MTGLGYYLTNYFRQIQLVRLENKMASEAQAISETLSFQINDGVPTEDVNKQVAQWANILGARITLILSEGTVLVDSHEDPEQMDNHLNRPEVQEALQKGLGTSIRFSQTLDFDMMYLAVPLISKEQIIGTVRISLPLEEVNASITQLHRAIILGTIFASILSIILASIIAERTTRPIRELTVAVQNMLSDDSEQESLPSSKNEVGQLAQAFNNVSAQLHDQITSLEAERSKFASVLEQMNDGVVIVDENGQIQLINPAAEIMFGIISRDVLNQSMAVSLRHHKIIALFRSSRASSQTQSTTLELSSLGLYLQGTAIPLGETLPGNTLLIFQDLTNIRRLETIRRDFISNISHELRTPLASLKALTETLLEGAFDDPPAARRFLQRMETEVDSLALMVQELLELSRIESGKVPLQLVPSTPYDLLISAADRLWLQAERSGLSIAIDCPEDLPAVLADPRRIEQVIVNLLHNAIKYSPSESEIILAAKQRDSMIEFSVTDSGIGIADDDLPRIFERFYKADRARSKAGTGLGLAISRHLVEAHSGKIWAESEEGRGSTFYFTLPVV